MINPYRALSDTIELSHAVSIALKKVDLSETLIIVTADHSHVLTIGGYATRGNPILRKSVGNDRSGEPRNTPSLADNRPYTTLGYANGRGFYFQTRIQLVPLMTMKSICPDAQT